MTVEVFLAEDAEPDIRDIWRYIAFGTASSTEINELADIGCVLLATGTRSGIMRRCSMLRRLAH